MTSLHEHAIMLEETLDRLKSIDPELVMRLLDEKVYCRTSHRLNRSALCRALGCTQQQLDYRLIQLREVAE